jgi:pimeloyl-ACP methyl ester carboxylesterase
VTPRARRYTSSDGLALHYDEYAPEGPRRIDVLCLPGLTRHSADFADVAARLAARGHRVVCPDLRGRGRSDYAADKSTYAPPQYFDDLRALAIAARLDRFACVGTSFGGLLAMALATVLPSSVRGVAMNDIGPEISRGGASRILDYISVDRVQPDWAAASRALREFLPNVLPDDPGGWNKLVRNTYREGADGKLHFDWDIAISANLAPGPDPEIDLWALWRAVAPLPVLAVRGGVSDILSPATLAAMKATKPDLTTLEIPGVGHTPTLDEPESRAALDAWLARIGT